MNKKGGKKKSIVIMMLILLIMTVAGYQFCIKPYIQRERDTKALRNTADSMMQAYMRKDLSQALSYTDLRNHSNDFGEHYFDYMKEKYQIDAMTATVLQSSENYADNFESIMLNIVRGYEIQSINVEEDRAVININCTVSNLSQAEFEDAFAEAGRAMLLGVGNVDWWSHAGEIIADPQAETARGTLGDISNEYMNGVIDSLFDSFNNRIVEADDEEISLVLQAHKESDIWIIEVDDVLKEF